LARFARAIGVAFLLLAIGSAHAATLVDFTGSVSQVPIDELFGDIHFGDTIQGSFSFDGTAADLLPADPATGVYSFNSPFGMTVTIAGHSFDATGSLIIAVVNGFIDQYTVLANSAAGDLTLELFFQDNSGTALSDDHLPLSLPTATQRDFHLDLLGSDGETQIDGQIDGRAAQVVPEPGSAVLMLGGLIAAALVGKTSARSTVAKI